MRPWKLWTARDYVGKSVRESHFSFREKSQKKAENGFQGRFWFSRGKKNAGRQEGVVVMVVLVVVNETD